MPVKKHAMKITTKQRAARKRNIEIARRAKKGGGSKGAPLESCRLLAACLSRRKPKRERLLLVKGQRR
jgi:hypothetical protein